MTVDLLPNNNGETTILHKKKKNKVIYELELAQYFSFLVQDKIRGITVK